MKTIMQQRKLLRRKGILEITLKYYYMLPKEKQKELYDKDFIIRRLFTPHEINSVYAIKCAQERIIEASGVIKTKALIEEEVEELLIAIDKKLKIAKKNTIILKKPLTVAQANKRYPKSDWRYEVSNDDTQLGYDEWMLHKVESDGYAIREDAPPQLTPRQIATVLFSLRYLEQTYDSSGYLHSEHLLDLKPLTIKEIDQLCQDINLNKISL